MRHGRTALPLNDGAAAAPFHPLWKVAHYQWNGTGADANSEERYALFPNLFDAVAPGAYGLTDALRTVAVLGQKGDDYYKCGGLGTYGDASNVLSVAFSPGSDELYVAWEVGTGDAWTPAACATYIKLNMAKYW
jgi:hypothetical protein